MNPGYPYEEIGKQFVAHYYRCYDSGDKASLCQLYHDAYLHRLKGGRTMNVSSDIEIHTTVQTAVDAWTRAACQLASTENEALMTFEGDLKVGQGPISEKLQAANYKTAHAITGIDCQPVADGSILVVVLGQVKTEGETNALGFTQTFLLKPLGDSFFIANDVFRLTLHNF